MSDDDRLKKIDRSVISVVTREEAHRQDIAYWKSRTPEERLEALESLRQTVYGYDPAVTRLQRVLEIIERE
ncbi:hypothetical protein hrd7_31500 [Leptolinea sp. HRD-7]|jgi:hypothetical protein|nr:hypothetical protein hrd7_31500 [Leptolinea sp. HRD-7]